MNNNNTMLPSSAAVCSGDSFPFEFFDINGTVVSGEVGADGLCTFPEANCGLDTSIEGCCQAKEGYTETGGNYMFFAFAFIFIPYIYLTTCAWYGYEEEEQQEKNEAAGATDNDAAAASAEAEEMGKEEDEQKTNNDADRNSDNRNTTNDFDDDNLVPSWVRAVPIPGFAFVFSLGLWFSITLQIMIPIWMKSSLQRELDVASRNALIAGEAFIVPYKEIFQFIEDIVLVRVNYAMARGQKKRTDQLVHAGIAGTLCTGILAGLVGTILGSIPSVLQTLTNPGVENDMELYPGCNLIMEDNELVFPYWLMEVWAIPGTQLGMVISGFLLGAMELPTLGWIASISVSMIPILWFSLVDSASNRLLLLSTAEFTGAWTLPVLSILYITCPLGKDLRNKTGVNLNISKLCNSFEALKVMQQQDSEPEEEDASPDGEQDLTTDQQKAADQDRTEQLEEDHTEVGMTSATRDDANAADPPAAEEEESTSKLLLEGLKIMVMDVVIQCCISISVYLALANDAAEGYKLTALQSALPAYGTAYAYGMGTMFKIAGPQLLTNKFYRVFATLARLLVGCAYLLVPLILGAVLPFREGLAFDTGGNACAYAKDEQCLPFFTKVFGENGTGGDFTLPFTFNFFTVGAAAEAVFFVLRATLLTLVDLDYMLICTGISVLAYVPCIIVASTVQPFAKHASAYFVAMYVPQLVLIVLFTVRIEILIRRILRGEKGGWSSEKSTRNLPESSSAAAPSPPPPSATPEPTNTTTRRRLSSSRGLQPPPTESSSGRRISRAPSMKVCPMQY